MKKFNIFHVLILVSLLAILVGSAASPINVQSAASPISGHSAGKIVRYYSAGAMDGWILESTETSGVGGTKNSAAAVFRVGDDAAKRQYRAILHFNTAGLPDNAVITGAWLWVKRHSAAGDDPIDHSLLLVDSSLLPAGKFGLTAALELNDFKTPGVLAGYFTYFPQVDGIWYRATLQSGGIANINRTGTTQYRLRFELDDNNNLIADYLMLYSGNAMLSYRPQLAVQFHLP